MNKFDLGDVVQCKYETKNVVGQVVLIADASASLLEFNCDRNNYWSTHFPNWAEGYIYKIWLPKPFKCIDYEDFLKYYEIEDSPSSIKVYNKMVDEMRILSFVEDELSMIAENGSDLSDKIRGIISGELVRKFS